MNTITDTTIEELLAMEQLLARDQNLAVVLRSCEKGLRPPPAVYTSKVNDIGEHRITLTYFGGHQIIIHLVKDIPIAVVNGGRTWIRVGEFNPTYHRI